MFIYSQARNWSPAIFTIQLSTQRLERTLIQVWDGIKKLISIIIRLNLVLPLIRTKTAVPFHDGLCRPVAVSGEEVHATPTPVRCCWQKRWQITHLCGRHVAATRSGNVRFPIPRKERWKWASEVGKKKEPLCHPGCCAHFTRSAVGISLLSYPPKITDETELGRKDSRLGLARKETLHY